MREDVEIGLSLFIVIVIVIVIIIVVVVIVVVKGGDVCLSHSYAFLTSPTYISMLFIIISSIDE